MSRFFFHIVDGQFVPDAIGIECATKVQVKTHAIQIAGEMIKELASAEWKANRLDLFVCDENNNTHLKLSFLAEDISGALDQLMPASLEKR